MARQTKAEKMRVALAKDVQQQLKSQAFRVGTGAYLEGVAYDAAYNLLEDKPDGDVRKLLGRKLRKCSVCGKGALLVAHILRNDKVVIKEFCDYADGGLTYDNPTDFTYRQWAEIEVLFEGAMGIHRERVGGDRNFEFLKEYHSLVLDDDDKIRLHQIMQLIIDSQGKRVLLPYDDR